MQTPPLPHSLTVKVLSGITEVAPSEWDACAGTANPFVTHAFLSALEDSGSATPEAGWAPRHLVAQDDEGRVLACAPLYLKSHSFGEYVFDWGWADAYHRLGGRYYPKLQCSIPFTPVTGPRLLVRPGHDAVRLRHALLAAMIELARRLEVSSLHITFAREEEWRQCRQTGLLPRLGEQYHWTNRGYAGFEDFLAALSSRKRKTIRRERERANALGLTIETLTGPDLRPEHWDAMYRFYIDTSGRKWGQPYLNRSFFHRLGETLADRVVLVLARDGKRPVAGALNLLGQDALYGRHWGALGDFPFLHFELCYYRALDFAIAAGLKRVEAGAQGEHKVQRGYEPVPTYSAHWLADERFAAMVARYLDDERDMVAEDIAGLAEHTPYRKA